MGRTIKELYDVNKIELNENSTSLEIWFNEVIDKDIEQLTLSDVLRMIRQKLFLDMALDKAMEFLNGDPFIGEYYSTELIQHLLKVDTSLLQKFSKEIRKAIDKANTHNLLDEEDRESFEQASHELSNLIK